MTPEIERLIKKIVLRDVQIKMSEEILDGQIINSTIINQILKDLEDEYNGNTQ